MSGMKPVDLYARVRHACRVEGLSQRETARRFGIDTKTVRKMLAFSVPPGYRRSKPPARPKLDPFTSIIDRMLEADRAAPQTERLDRRGAAVGWILVEGHVLADLHHQRVQEAERVLVGCTARSQRHRARQRAVGRDVPRASGP